MKGIVTMNKRNRVAGVWLVGVLLMLVGCGSTTVIVVDSPPGEVDVDTEVVYIDDEATIAEIEAVRTLTFSNQKTDHLKRIARRHNLGPAAQVHLVDITFELLTFDNEKVDVIERLIKNPVFCGQAKSKVLAHLDDLTFDSHKRKLLKALDRRGPVMAFPEVLEVQSGSGS